MTRLTAKSSTIFVGTRNATEVYYSMQDVPEVYRRRLQEFARNGNAVKILIADKLGREEIMRALGSKAPGVMPEEAKTPARKADLAVPRIPILAPRSVSLRTWIELLLPAAIGASLWLFIGSRF